MNEVNVLKEMDHPNIIRIFEFYEDEESYHIVTELWEGGELFDYLTELGSVTENVAADIMKQLISAIRFWHEKNIVHRDLKPENWLLERKPQPRQKINIKVIDFGTSSLVNPE